ncbi:MAG: caspase family protein [Mesorhizobium sp.]|nr:MAG: caspase family protein [Mesorhizobium sp.]
MAMIFRIIWACVAAIVLLTAPAYAGKRIALVIGNGAYQKLSKDSQLPSPVRDAQDIAQALGSIGFEMIQGDISDLGLSEMLDKITELVGRVEEGDTVLFYFSGHGVGFGASNYLLPSDIPPLTRGQDQNLTKQAVSEADIIRQIQAKGAGSVVMIIDACRNNPFERNDGKGIGRDKGLVDGGGGGKGVFTLYAAGFGQTALDRLDENDTDPNSLFTRVLIPLLKKKDLTHVALAKEAQTVVDQLASRVNHDQFPAYYDQIQGFFSFNPGGAKQSFTNEVEFVWWDDEYCRDIIALVNKHVSQMQYMFSGVVDPNNIREGGIHEALFDNRTEGNFDGGMEALCGISLLKGAGVHVGWCHKRVSASQVTAVRTKAQSDVKACLSQDGWTETISAKTISAETAAFYKDSQEARIYTNEGENYTYLVFEWLLNR